MIHRPTVLSSSGSDDGDELLAAAFVAWAEKHPRPDMPLLSTAEGRTFTPAQLADEVRRRTRIGLAQLRALRLLAETEPNIGIEGVAQALRELAENGGHDEPPPSVRV